MRLFTIAAVCLSSSLLCSAALAETRFVPTDHSTATMLCISAATDSRLVFKREVNDSNMRMQTVANKISCNDMPIASFAQFAGNDKVYQHLRGYMKGQVQIQEIAAQPGQTITIVGSSAPQ